MDPNVRPESMERITTPALAEKFIAEQVAAIKAQVKEAYGREAVEVLEAFPYLTKVGKEKLLERVSELLEIKQYNTRWMLDLLSE